MLIPLITRHADDFDIVRDRIDPSRSPCARLPDYGNKLANLFAELGVEMALWAWPLDQCPLSLESHKPIEYLLEVPADRIIAYVDEITWLDYLDNKRHSFKFSIVPCRFDVTSVLVSVPILMSDLKEKRRLAPNAAGDGFSIVERMAY